MSVRPAGFRDLQAQLNELAERADDPSPVLPQIADAFRQHEQAQFAGGRGWAPLSAEYAARKAREGRSARVGVYTGGLERSLTRDGARHHIERFTRDRSFVVGSSNPVANLFGGKHRSRDQPQRKPVRLTAALRRRWLQMVQDYLLEQR